MQAAKKELEDKCRAAKAASKKLAFINTETKNKALLNISRALVASQKEILAANKLDYKESEASGMSIAMLDRLMLSQSRLEAIAQDVKTVAALPDPVGEIIEQRILPNGLRLSKKRVPLGVIGSIYESRPNVTIDISVLCLKAGNAAILRGGKEALHSNKVLASTVQQAISEAGMPQEAVQFIDSTDKSLVKHMLQLREAIDLMIPRGSASLIRFVAENASMPVVTGGIGVCHTFVDKDADLNKAVAIAYNAKVQRPTVCNALDSLLVHAEIAERYLPMIAKEWNQAGVEMHCDNRSFTILKSIPSSKLLHAQDEDWGKEFLALIAAVKVVDSLDEALQHIERYGSGHSEAIITRNKKTAARFLNEVDAACVYSNASTRFTDGSQFGLGAEIGISTQKIHARGPMALRELTSYKWIVVGDGQVRP